MFSELVRCVAFDSHRNLSHSTDYHKIYTESSLESFTLGNLQVNSTSIGFVAAHSYKSPYRCPAEMMVSWLPIINLLLCNSLHDITCCVLA